MILRAQPQKGASTDHRHQALITKLRLAKEHLDANKLEAAARGYASILHEYKRNLDALYFLGCIRQMQDRQHDAARLFARVLKGGGKFATVHFNYAIALRSLGEFEEASVQFELAADCDRADLSSYISCANMWNQQRRPDLANRFIDLALTVTAALPGSLNDLANVLREVGRVQEALSLYDRALEQLPNHPAIHSNRGLALFCLERYDDAVAAFTSALQLNPELILAYAGRGAALLRLERPHDAVADLRAAASALPNDEIVHFNLGNALKDAGYGEEALISYNVAIKLAPQSTEFLNNKGDLLREMGRLDESYATFANAIRIDPANASIHYNLASLHSFTLNDPIIKSLEAKLIRINENSTEDAIYYHYSLGKAFADCGEHEKSFNYYIAGANRKRSVIDYDESVIMAYFDRIEKCFPKSYFESHTASICTSRQPIFVCGMPRSGTTLVEQILASHPEVHGAGETPCFSQAADCLAVMLQTRSGRVYPEYADIFTADDFEQIATAYLQLTKVLTGGKKRVVDKQLTNFFFLGFIHLALPNARIIHVRRNPMDTCVSCFTTLFSREQHFTYDLGELGRFYRRYEQLMEHWRGALPSGAFLEVNYEDVVANLDDEALRILAYCDLPWDDACLQFNTTQRIVRTASATQVRKPIYATAVNRWRRHEEALLPLLNALKG